MVDEDFEQVYTRHLAPVWRFVRARVPVDAEAEDLTSEVFARAAHDWQRYDPRRGSARAWLLGIARHVVVDWWRRHGRELAWERLDRVPEPAAAAESEPDAAAVGESERRELHRHLGVLSEREREAVALRFAGGLKAAEVGALLDVSETGARMLVYRAISKLRAVMADG